MEENTTRAMTAKWNSPQWKQYLIQLLKMNLLPTAIMTVFWLLLGWIRAAGVQWLVLWPLNFLTGALAGMNGSALGGTIGKTILLVMFNSAFRGILAQRGDWKTRRNSFWKEFKGEAKSNFFLKMIPQYANLKLILGKRTPQACGWAGLGLGAALLVYPFLTGDGSLVNSMVCVALCVNISKQLMKQRGLLISLINLLLAKKSMRSIDRDVVNRILAGYTVGMAAAVAIAAVGEVPYVGTVLWLLLAKVCPWLLVAAGLLGVCWERVKPYLQKKQDAQEKGGAE